MAASKFRKGWKIEPFILKLFIFIGFAIIECSCAVPPTNKFIRTGPSYNSEMPKMKKIALIADVCLIRATKGEPYWSISESKMSERHMLKNAQMYLASKGYKITYREAPFVGSFKDANLKFKYALRPGDKVEEMYPPLFVAEGLNSDAEYKQALLKYIPCIMNAFMPIRVVGDQGYTFGYNFVLDIRKSQSPDRLCAGSEMKQALSIVAKKTGGEAILFLVGDGAIVPSGTLPSLAKPVAPSPDKVLSSNGIFYKGPEIGNILAASYHATRVLNAFAPESFLNTYVVLVDTSTGEILWSNCLQQTDAILGLQTYLGFTSSTWFKETWAWENLYYIPQVK